MKPLIPLRWAVMGVFVLSGALNYLDRQVLAALAPLLRTEFGLSNADYGSVLAAFSIAYAVCSPIAGLCIDRFGLNRSISVAVGLWSLAGAATGFVNGLSSLLMCRTALGAAESAGVPASGKAIHLHLPAEERALGNALSQIGLSVGAIVAPPLATWLALRHGWRSAFLVTGFVGLLWIPLWLWTSKKAPGTRVEPQRNSAGPGELLRDGRMWGMIAATVLSMTVYTLWTNWTTLYIKETYGTTLTEANWLAPLPYLFAYAGGLIGGWLSLRWMKKGMNALAARRRACLASALALLATAAVGIMPTAVWAAVAIAFSFFAVSAWSVNLYTMPLDAFGAERAAFSVAVLTAAYGAMQAVVSPLLGAMIDHYGYTPVFVIVSVLPLAAWGILEGTTRRA